MKSFKAEILGLKKDEINSQVPGILKICLLWLEQMNSQWVNERTYVIISQTLEYITTLS